MNTTLQIPKIGMMLQVRTRRAIVSSVQERNDGSGSSFLIRVDYLDTKGPSEDFLLWEIEEKIGASLYEPKDLPKISTENPLSNRDFDALVRAARWTSLDPIRYSQTDSLSNEEIQEIWKTTGVRRLKREINEMDKASGKEPRFAYRALSPLALYFSKKEKNLFSAFDAFRKKVRSQFVHSNLQ